MRWEKNQTHQLGAHVFGIPGPPIFPELSTRMLRSDFEQNSNRERDENMTRKKKIEDSKRKEKFQRKLHYLELIGGEGEGERGGGGGVGENGG